MVAALRGSGPEIAAFDVCTVVAGACRVAAGQGGVIPAENDGVVKAAGVISGSAGERITVIATDKNRVVSRAGSSLGTGPASYCRRVGAHGVCVVVAAERVGIGPRAVGDCDVPINGISRGCA